MVAHERTGDRVVENPAIGARRYYHPLQKDYATFLKTSEETGGEYTLIEIEVAPGGGNVPHYHKTYDEHFEVLRGDLEVMVGAETRTLRPGDKAVAPMNTRHNFRNTTDGSTTFLVELRPGSSGFEKALKAGYGLASGGTSTTSRCSWSGRIYGCRASSRSSSRCSGSWRSGPGARG